MDWQAVLGGTEDDIATTIAPTADGGYIIGGFSNSATNGNKTAPPRGDYDYWVVRLDGSGNALWDRSYGGSTNDSLEVAVPTSDGGFLFGGSSLSPANGTKTSTNFGGNDYWLVRANANGEVQWDRSFGGSGHDTLFSVEQTSDGGLLLGGSSSSAPGGNKTSESYGTDFWLVRLDASGQKLWDRTYGAGFELLRAVRQIPDGGFFIGGTSYTGIGGNKTSTNHSALPDYWIVRIDHDGNKLWERQLGGRDTDMFRDLVPLSDGGVIVAGYSLSFPGGTKTAPRRGTFYDYWVVRLDADGNQIWDQTYGNGAGARLRRVARLRDDLFVLYGHSTTGAAGTKTSPGYGGLDYWLVGIDDEGDQLWDQSFGGTANDGDGIIVSLPEGGIIVTTNSVAIVGTSQSGTNGNKFVPQIGKRDFWVVRLSDSTRPELASSVPGFQVALPQCAVGSNTFQVWNRGTGAVAYHIATDVPWLTVSPTNGFSADQTNTHLVAYSNSEALGPHHANVRFLSSSDGSTLLTLEVSLTVTSPPAPVLRMLRSSPANLRLLLGPAACPIISEFSSNLVDWSAFRTNPPSTVEREITQPAGTTLARFYRARTP
jgi:hypothetical protein